MSYIFLWLLNNWLDNLLWFNNFLFFFMNLLLGLSSLYWFFLCIHFNLSLSTIFLLSCINWLLDRFNRFYFFSLRLTFLSLSRFFIFSLIDNFLRIRNLLIFNCLLRIFNNQRLSGFNGFLAVLLFWRNYNSLLDRFHNLNFLLVFRFLNLRGQNWWNFIQNRNPALKFN